MKYDISEPSWNAELLSKYLESFTGITFLTYRNYLQSLRLLARSLTTWSVIFLTNCGLVTSFGIINSRNFVVFASGNRTPKHHVVITWANLVFSSIVQRSKAESNEKNADNFAYRCQFGKIPLEWLVNLPSEFCINHSQLLMIARKSKEKMD